MTSPKLKPPKVGAIHYPPRLVEKYRPSKIADFLGLAEPKLILGAFAKNPRPEAFLFKGPPGLGKTTMAQALCAEVGGAFKHIPSSRATVPDLQSILSLTEFQSFLGTYHFFLVDEADCMTTSAQIALLSKLDSTAWTNTSIFCFTCNKTEHWNRVSSPAARSSILCPRDWTLSFLHFFGGYGAQKVALVRAQILVL